MKLYLNGGGNVAKGEAKHIDKLAVMSSKSKKVTILLLSKKERWKIEEYSKFSPGYFKRLGAKKVDLILPNSSKMEIAEKTKNPDLVYLPGGDTRTLLKHIKRLKLLNFIKKANVISGNSAGAIAQASGGYGTKNNKLIKGFSLLKIIIKVHYEGSEDKRLLKLSKKEDIYAIPERSAIVYDRKMKFIGPVWKFSRATKKKVNP